MIQVFVRRHERNYINRNLHSKNSHSLAPRALSVVHSIVHSTPLSCTKNSESGERIGGTRRLVSRGYDI